MTEEDAFFMAFLCRHYFRLVTEPFHFGSQSDWH